MKRFIEGEERSEVSSLPQCPDAFIAEDNPVRVVLLCAGGSGMCCDSCSPASVFVDGQNTFEAARNNFEAVFAAA